jgi:hypothetical protein
LEFKSKPEQNTIYPFWFRMLLNEITPTSGQQ